MGLHHLVIVCLLSKQVCLGEPEMKMMDIATLFTAQSSPSNYPLTWNVISESQVHYSIDNAVPINSDNINKNIPAAIKEAKLRVHRSAEEKLMNKPIHTNDSLDNETESKPVLYSGEELKSFLPERRSPVASLIDHSDEDYTRNSFHFDNEDRFANREGGVFREPKVETANDKNSRVSKKEVPSNYRNISEPKSQNASEKDEDEDEQGTSEVSEYSSKKEEEPGRHIVSNKKPQFQRSEMPVISDEQIKQPFSTKSTPQVSEHNHSVTGKGFKSVNYKPSDVEYNDDSSAGKFSSAGEDSYSYRNKLGGKNLAEKSRNDEESERTEKPHSSIGRLRASDETRFNDADNVRQETPKSTGFYKEPDKYYKDLGRQNVEGPTENDRLHNNYKGKSESYKKLRDEEEVRDVGAEGKEEPISRRPSIERGAEEGRRFPGPAKKSTEGYKNLPERNKEDSTRRVLHGPNTFQEKIKEKHVSPPRKLQSVYNNPREFDVKDNEESRKPPAIREETEEEEEENDDDDDDEDNVSSKENEEEEEEEEYEPPPRNIEQRTGYNRYPNKETQTSVPPVGHSNGRLVNRAPLRNYIPNNSRENINNNRVQNLRQPAKSTFTGRQNPNPGRAEEGRDYVGRREPHLAPKLSYNDGGKYRKNNYKPNPPVQTLPSQRGSKGRYVPISYVSTYDGDSNAITTPKPEDVQEDGLFSYGIGENDFIGLPKWESYRTKPKVRGTQHIQQEGSSVNTRSTTYAEQPAVLPRRKANTYTYKEEEAKPRSYRNKSNPPISSQRIYNRVPTQQRDEAKHPKPSIADLNGNEYGSKMNRNFEEDNAHKESDRGRPKNVIGTVHSKGYKYPTNESPRGGKKTRNGFQKEYCNEESGTDKPNNEIGTVGRGYKYSMNESPRGGKKIRNKFKIENSEEESAINKPKDVVGNVGRNYIYPTNESPRGRQNTRNTFKTENSEEESAINKPKNVVGTVGRSYMYSRNESPRGGQNTRNKFETENSEEESAINKSKKVVGTVGRSYMYPTNESRNNFNKEKSDERDENKNKGDYEINTFKNTSNKPPIKEDWRRNHNRENEDEPYTKYEESEEERERYRNRDDRGHDIEDEENSEEYPRRYQTFSKHQPNNFPATDNKEENDEQHEVVYKDEDNYEKEKYYTPQDKYYKHEDDRTSSHNPYYNDDHTPYDSDHFDHYHSGYQGSKNERFGDADDSEREDERETAVSREVVRDEPHKIHANSQSLGRGRGGEYHRGSTDEGDKLYQGSVSSVAVTQPAEDSDNDEDDGNKEDSLHVAYGAGAARRFGGTSSSNAATNSHQDKHRHKGSLLQGDSCKYRRGKATNGVRDVEDWEEYGRRREYHYTLGDKELADLFGGQNGASTFGGPYNVLEYAPPLNNGAHLLQDSVNQYVFGWFK